ncbi:hypothetical protein FUAX_16650 [Fulvitalea axinellae]|uniref:Hemerythrin-like domain-containing protein n=1 Tax=Fulvitalea axinellae TaxID=1182444 RepID=A0AAU9CZU8_9BACT|nr:hypothetical protein FUAX_16650 [Fulvitalea axinellae]
MNTQETLNPGHPVSIYKAEAELIKAIISDISKTDIENDPQTFFNQFNELCEVEKRFARKENQLFPFLEKKGWNNPSQGMWSFHDTLRAQAKIIREHLEKRDFDKIAPNLYHLSTGIIRLLEIEENVLFPNALELLDENDWKSVRNGEEEIGWMLKETPPEYGEKAEQAYVHPSEDFEQRELTFSTEDKLRMDEGYLSHEQINLLLKTMPLDITYVDEDDKVIFYNRGEERVFPRSPGIIGREVRFCHPPKSVGTVLRILEEFRKGTQNTAEFWFNHRGHVLYIRYFAVRNANKEYKGVIEMSQDITEIQKLSGEQRLLDWD